MFRKRTPLLTIAAALALLLSSGCAPVVAEGNSATSSKTAAAPASAGDDLSRLKEAWEKNAEGSRVIEANPTPIAGIYEVVLETGGRKEIIYSDKSGNYAVMGALIDIQNKTDVTEKRLADISKVDFDKLPLEAAVKEVRGNGSRRVAVFSDPDCPYCRSFERDILTKTDDITVYTFLLPIASLHPDAERKARDIACADDPSRAWLAWMRDGKAVPAAPAGCDGGERLKKAAETGNVLGVFGTPTIVFADGSRIGGRPQSAAVFEKLLSEHGKADGK